MLPLHCMPYRKPDARPTATAWLWYPYQQMMWILQGGCDYCLQAAISSWHQQQGL
jgi:hypothetical protein